MENSDSILEKVIPGLKEHRELIAVVYRGSARTNTFMRLFCLNCKNCGNCLVYATWKNPMKYAGPMSILPRFNVEKCQQGLFDWYNSHREEIIAKLDMIDRLMDELKDIAPQERRKFLCARCSYGKSLEDSEDCANDSNNRCIVGLWDILMPDADASFDNRENNE